MNSILTIQRHTPRLDEAGDQFVVIQHQSRRHELPHPSHSAPVPASGKAGFGAHEKIHPVSHFRWQHSI
jgi:hypothetical protein